MEYRHVEPSDEARAPLGGSVGSFSRLSKWLATICVLVGVGNFALAGLVWLNAAASSELIKKELTGKMPVFDPDLLPTSDRWAKAVEKQFGQKIEPGTIATAAWLCEWSSDHVKRRGRLVSQLILVDGAVFVAVGGALALLAVKARAINS